MGQEQSFHIKWPPSLRHHEVIGEMKDVSGRRITRDIGLSSHLGSNTYQLYGDTFCHNFSDDFVGVTTNTYSLWPNPKDHPTRTQYLDGDVDENDLVGPLIPFTESEQKYTDDPANRDANKRVVLWCFGGIIQGPGEGSRDGWVFFDKLLTENEKMEPHLGMGVARVRVLEDKRLCVERVMGDEMIFSADEPHFGSTTHLIDSDGYVYLYGSHDPDKANLDMQMHLARIPHSADFTQRSNYEFWIHTLDGKGGWSPTYKNTNSLRKLWELDSQLHGKVFKSEGFGPKGKPYVFIGVDKFMSKKFCVGVAPEPHGPWEVRDIGELPDYSGEERGGPKYCLYPHLGISELGNGEVVCSWTDGTVLGGKVILGKFCFEKQGEEKVYGDEQAFQGSEDQR